jgi:hypothetical protein
VATDDGEMASETEEDMELLLCFVEISALLVAAT